MESKKWFQILFGLMLIACFAMSISYAWLSRIEKAVFVIDSINLDETTGRCTLVYSGDVPSRFVTKDVFEKGGEIIISAEGYGSQFLFSRKNYESHLEFRISPEIERKKDAILVEVQQRLEMKAGDRIVIYKFKDKNGDIEQGYIEINLRE